MFFFYGIIRFQAYSSALDTHYSSLNEEPDETIAIAIDSLSLIKYRYNYMYYEYEDSSMRENPPDGLAPNNKIRLK
ncbi:uncharacterized protein MYCFIDRAFT_179258 [Pseudocercospora fijiensis CIRAD86]|uniref:Uncharacterized protein n=1 Tax=Pseudocercospora fijiensis (strain CIRAD86) TaxID=383855 RepID=M3A051_PSEFD|nr:uncharacterized protein MYCFIDRAFT_179258 [Pseudocercospora fijiensis CIRAD86]EME77766.1 hypothetical protein MYCFIDRAFT_179258 [Pseudocercospora fijiensis CIRAD86]